MSKNSLPETGRVINPADFGVSLVKESSVCARIEPAINARNQLWKLYHDLETIDKVDRRGIPDHLDSMRREAYAKLRIALRADMPPERIPEELLYLPDLPETPDARVLADTRKDPQSKNAQRYVAEVCKYNGRLGAIFTLIDRLIHIRRDALRRKPVDKVADASGDALTASQETVPTEKRKRGRPRERNPQEDKKIVGRWKEYKRITPGAPTIEEFCQENGRYKVSEVKAAIERVRKQVK